jgi:hypothetical protein
LLNWGAVDDEVNRKLFLKAVYYVCHESDS